MAIVYEEQRTDISWYSDPIPNGSAENNYARIIELRKKFCHPLTINKDGTLNKKYFETTTHETAMNWNDIEILQLYEGIFKHGIDSVESWIKIQSDYLPQRDFIEVRLKLSQIFGTQDLSKYKGAQFKTEKEIKQEFEKNKKEGTQNGNWNDKCNVSLKQNVANLSKDEIKELEQSELDDWIKNVYDNPIYIYRTDTKTKEKGKSRAKSRSKSVSNNKKSAPNNNKKAAKKTQKNTIDKMLKKKSAEKPEKDEDKEMVDVEKKEKKKVNKKKKKVTKRKPKQPLLPEESDDEDMLCVE